MIDVTILCSDASHPVNPHLRQWADEQAGRARVRIVRHPAELTRGDFLFLVSCHQIVGRESRAGFRHALVLHASDLPQGRGMSPHVWQVLEGRDRLPVTLLNAEDAVDSGDIWHQVEFAVAPTDLFDEINDKLFRAEIQLLSWALDACDRTRPRPQQGTPTYYRRRTPADSEVDPQRPLADAFDLLRVADPDRYPAFFHWRGQKYRIRIDKL